MLRRSVALFFLVALISLASPVRASAPLPNLPYQIYLRSRQFVPPEGIAESARSRIAAHGGALHVLVQLRAIPDQATKDRLAALGLSLKGYLPDRAWFATIDASRLEAISLLPELRWLGPVDAADKLPARLTQSQPLKHAVAADGSVSLRVYYFEDVTAAAALALALQHGAALQGGDAASHWLEVMLPLAQIQALAAEDAIQWISETSPPPVPFNDSIRSRVRVNDVQAPPYNLTGAGVSVGMWDCTLVSLHLDFLNPQRVFDQPGEHTACSPSDTTEDHATHVAGILAGSGANSQAQGGTPNQWRGMAPGVQVFSYDFYSPTLEIPVAITDWHIDLAQNSWGYPPAAGTDCHLVYGNYDQSAADYDAIVKGSAGKKLSVIFAAGNSQGACDTWNSITPPATAKNVIAVGMTDAINDTLFAPSSIGPTDDGRIKPDVVAPGARSDFLAGIQSTLPGDTYGREYGTSMSAPVVSGIIALLLQQYHITTGSPFPNPWPSTQKALLIHGAIDLGNPGPDYRYGWGRVDARNSVDLVRRTKYLQDTVSTGQGKRISVQLLGCEPSLKTTLVWDDPPASPNALAAYINDLDLTLVSPGGAVYYAWQLDPSNPQNAASSGPSGNHRDNVEQVLVPSPAAGTWTVVVTGTAVPQGPQDYSLVTDAFATAPVLASVSPTTTQPGAQVVVRGDNFGCGQGSGTLTLGGVPVTVAPGGWSNDAITLTVPSNARSGSVLVTTSAGASNAQPLVVLRSVYLPSVSNNFPPAYHWIDASDGTRVADGDDVITPLTLPFPFRFYGTAYTTATVSSNGFIGFGPLAQSYPQSTCVPATTTPNNAIYAFWADLDATGTISATPAGGIFYKSLGSTAVIEWQNVPRYGTSEYETFEIVLGADNSISLQYQSLANLNDVTVGIENASGTVAVQAYCHRSNPPIETGAPPAAGELLYYTS